MHLLNKLIAALIELKLSKEGWSLLADIYFDLKEKKFSAFETAFLKDHAVNGDIATFMRCFFEITEEMKIINELIEAKAPVQLLLSNDDRILIISSLLTDKLEDLKMMAQKMEWLSLIAARHTETQNTLRLYLQAISLRVRQLNNQPVSPRESFLSRSTLQEIVKNIFSSLLINKLHYHCRQYKNKIEEKFKSYLKDNDAMAYLYYFTLNKISSLDTLFAMEEDSARFYRFCRDEDQDFHQDNLSMVKSTPEYFLLKDKYTHLKNLLQILDRQSGQKIYYSDEELLQIFAEYFTESDLSNERLFAPGLLFFSTNYHIENEFIRACSEIIGKIGKAATSQLSYSSKDI